MRVRLHPSATVDQTIALLNTLSTNASGAVYPAAAHVADVREGYVRWAISTEQQLLSVISRQDVNRIFDNPRHRDLCSMPPGSQMSLLISAEVTAKAAELKEIADDLIEARARMARSPGVPTIVDANVLLQYHRLDQIKWASIVGGQARIMLPLRVIEELDAMKYDPKERLRDVARDLLPWLESLFPGPDAGPVPANGPDGATVEVLLADRPRYRPSDADEEILDVYHEVRLLAATAKLVTGDTGMRMRARAQGIEACPMPSKPLRRPTTVAPTSP